MRFDEKGIGILGMGSCLPEKILTNSDLEKMVDTSDEWILKRTGISERRILAEDEPIYNLGITAAKRALSDAGLDAEAIGMIILTTTTPDYLTPATACLIQKGIGATNAAAFDMNAACTGFVYGLYIGSQFIMTGAHKYVMVVSCEGMSKVVEKKDRNTCVLFGDGAGAAIIGEVEKGYGILSSYIAADGSLGKKITMPCCTLSPEDIDRREFENKKSLWQDGQEVFKFASKIMPYAVDKVMEGASMAMEDIKCIVPHQANIRIIDSAAKRLGVSMDKVYITIHKYGNMSSASIPVALEEAYASGSVKRGDNIILVGFGGGLTWGSVLIKWNK